MRRAFTLIELLVVISIIALLIAILLPALSAARSSAQRTQCLINQKQMVVAMTAFSTDNDGVSPPRGDTGIDVGMLSIYYGFVDWSAAINVDTRRRYGQYRRAGVVMNEGYANDPAFLYCPLLSDTWWGKPRAQNPSVSWQSGFFYDGEFDPNTIKSMATSYFYRETYQGTAYKPGVAIPTTVSQYKNIFDNVIDLERDPSDMVIYADAFAKIDMGVAETHRDSYNFARIDGSADSYSDPGGEIANIRGGSDYHASNTRSHYVEQAFESFRRGSLVSITDLASP